MEYTTRTTEGNNDHVPVDNTNALVRNSNNDKLDQSIVHKEKVSGSSNDPYDKNNINIALSASAAAVTVTAANYSSNREHLISRNADDDDEIVLFDDATLDEVLLEPQQPIINNNKTDLDMTTGEESKSFGSSNLMNDQSCQSLHHQDINNTLYSHNESHVMDNNMIDPNHPNTNKYTVRPNILHTQQVQPKAYNYDMVHRDYRDNDNNGASLNWRPDSSNTFNNNINLSTIQSQQVHPMITYNNNTIQQDNSDNNNNNGPDHHWNQEYWQLFMSATTAAACENHGENNNNSDCITNSNDVDTSSSSQSYAVQHPQQISHQNNAEDLNSNNDDNEKKIPARKSPSFSIYAAAASVQSRLLNDNNDDNDKKRPARKPPPPVTAAATSEMVQSSNTGNQINSTDEQQLPPPPLRALSAYNFFFIDERQRLLNNIVEIDTSKEKADMLLQQHMNRDRSKKRIHCKTHGKIPFAQLSKMISKRWKGLDDNVKEFYKQIALIDYQRYQKEKYEYKIIEKNIKKAKRIAAQKLERKEKAAEKRAAKKKIADATTTTTKRSIAQQQDPVVITKKKK